MRVPHACLLLAGWTGLQAQMRECRLVLADSKIIEKSRLLASGRVGLDLVRVLLPVVSRHVCPSSAVHRALEVPGVPRVGILLAQAAGMSTLLAYVGSNPILL